MVGKTVSHYRIIEPLGEGGMGVVYKAEDTRLGRLVALKFLPEGLARERSALDRFEQEARAISALNHPHICTIYDIGEAEQQPFMVLEYLEGQTLKGRCGPPLGSDEVIDLGLQVTDALEAAHAKGIVHRDVKPANIFVTTRGTAKLLDFGIAKLVADRQALSLTSMATVGGFTEPGVTVGTAQYMSPEQVRGEPLDGRTDLFSLGVVLYELATGRAPFQGPTPGVVWHEILTKAPAPPMREGSAVSAELERVVLKALEKDRNLRYQSAKDLHVDLERARAADRRFDRATHTRDAVPSIVVLPFENLSPDPENAFFSDGLTEEIIADLSKVRALRVISRTSAMTFKGAKRSVPSIAQDLNVRYALEGSVRRAGDSLRITAQLIDAAADTHLWAEKYTGTLHDVFDLQEQLSRRIVDALKITLTADEDRRLATRPIHDIRALDCYLRAWQEIGSFSEAGLDRALALVNQALGMVGENALLYASAAIIHWQYHNAGIKVSEETLQESDALAARALRLDPNLSAAFFATGSVAWTRGDLSTAARQYKRSLELEPNGHALAMLSFVYALAGRIPSARRYADRAMAVDPLNAWVYFVAGLAALLNGEIAAAAERMGKGLEVIPDDPVLSLFLPIVRAYGGQHEWALEQFGKLMKSDAPFLRFMSSMYSAALRRDREAVRAVAASADAAAFAIRDREMSWLFADCLAHVSDTDEALRWLENSVERGFVNHRFFVEFDPFMESLRGNRRFVALMDRAREKERAFEI